jgi:ABC-type ATPase involved in cell division
MNLLLENRDNGSTVIVATHDLRLMGKFPGRVIELKYGQIKKDTLAGPHPETSEVEAEEEEEL